MHRTLTRRTALGVTAASLGVAGLSGCSGGTTAYDQAVADLTRPLPPNPEFQDLVRYATLAANGHNTQPWIFRQRGQGVDILPDFSRHTPAVDPDDHHLFASLGCATENLQLAAQARGRVGEPLFDPTGDGMVQVDLNPGEMRDDPLFAAIPARQCSRVSYDGRSTTPDVVGRLALAANRYGVNAIFVTDQAKMEEVLSLVVEGNSRQIDDPAFVTELKDWLRFNPTSAVTTRDGLYSACSGNPTVPSWLGPLTFDLFFTKDAENAKYVEHIRSSAGLVIFVAASDDKEGWVNAGRAYQRFALQATVEGLKNAFVNQAVEVRAMRQRLQDLLGLGDQRPNLVVRYGYGPTMPKSLRRPATEVIA